MLLVWGFEKSFVCAYTENLMYSLRSEGSVQLGQHHHLELAFYAGIIIQSNHVWLPAKSYIMITTSVKYGICISSYALTHTHHGQSLLRWHEATYGMGVLQTDFSSHVAAETLSWWLRLCCLRVCHPWWHQMFKTSLCMCVCVCCNGPWIGVPNDYLFFYSYTQRIRNHTFFF